MGFFNRLDEVEKLDEDKTDEQREAHTGGQKLDKTDLKAILIASLTTFVPVLLIIVLVVFGLLFLIFAL